MNKKMIAAVTALTMVFGAAVCPMAGVAAMSTLRISLLWHPNIKGIKALA